MRDPYDEQRPRPADTVLTELTALEPIFHTAAFGTSVAQAAARMAEDYWEIGASGRRYTRADILEHLARAPAVLAEAAGWQCREHALRPLDADTFLLTYRLQQGTRGTRRATLWQRRAQGWVVLYHQGTLEPA